MRKSIGACLAISAAMIGSAALAALAAPSAGSAGSLRGDRVLCRRVVPTGSMLVQAIVCRTQAGWHRAFGEVGRDEPEEMLALSHFPRAGQTLQTGSGAWDRMPALRERPGRLPYRYLVAMVESLLKSGQCTQAGQSDRAFDIEVAFAARVDPDGTVSRLVVSEGICAPVAVLVGQTVFARSDRGDFRPSGEARARWYRGRMNFTLSG